MAQVTSVEGTVAAGFEPVRDAFADNFVSYNDKGASFALYVDGELKVDLWGGVADVNTGRPWTEDTLVLVYSATKGATSTVCLRLAQLGRLDLDALVTDYWPEFGQAGKENTTVRMLLRHQAGLPLLEQTLTREELLAASPVVRALEAQKPIWEPGRGYGYHALTFGWLMGELILRATGETLGTVFAREVADPLNLDLFIGLPESEDDRVAPLVAAPPPDPEALAAITDPEVKERLKIMSDPNSFFARVLTTNGALPTPNADVWNEHRVWRVEQPAANAITNGRALAKLYASCVGEVDGVRILNDATLDDALVEQGAGPDRVLTMPGRHGTGFQLSDELLSPASFGHRGAGGALGFGDREAKVGFGYAQNQLGGEITGEQPRRIGLIKAVRKCLGL
jgi:CubicO group peptidase (beta-lactamase class C family)